MGIFIDRHFYSELFEEKKVNCHHEMYLLLFNTIWPRSKNFEQFLSSSEISLKTEYAKKIYEDFAFINNVFLPSFTILNVLNDQYHDLSCTDAGYISQDHVIHSINLYVFGIYLFFNSSKIHKKILNSQNNDSIYSRIKDFVIKWQIFSLYHDVGYYFEDSKMIFKKVDEYNNIFDYILKNFISRHISKTFTFKALAERHCYLLDNAFLNNDIGPWYDTNGNKTTTTKVKEKIKNFVNAVCIDSITSDEDFSQVLPLLNNKEHLITVYNEHGNCILLLIRKRFNVRTAFYKNSSLVGDLLIDGILNTTNPKYTYRYYLLDIQNDAFWDKAISEPIVRDDIYSQLPQNLATNISMNSDSIQELFFAINDWILAELSLDGSEEIVIYKRNYEICLKDSFVNVITEKIKEYLKEKTLDNDSLLDAIIQILNICKKGGNHGKIFNEIRETAAKLYEQHYATTHNFNGFFSEQYKDLSTSSIVKKDSDLLSIIAKTDDNIVTNPFAHDDENDFHVALYTKISNLATSLNINLNELKQYHPPYAFQDHGVMSAGLLFQFACFSHDLKMYCKNNNRLILGWNFSYSDETSFLDLCAESIFSVLLHNIYNKQSAPSFGIDYCYVINKNPFSFFCTFFDTIQKWGRPKKVNLSRTILPINNLLEDEFDIDISEGNICIKCLKCNIEKIQEIIQNSESFLPGISQLIEVTEFST